MRKPLLAILLSICSSLAFAQNIYVSKGNSFHAYQTGSIESITFTHPDSMTVTWGGEKRSFARKDIDSLSLRRPDIQAGAKAVSRIYASETFSTDFGTFTNEHIKGTPWIIDFKTAKATGYANSKSTASESYLVSPAYDMTTTLKATLSFQYILAYSRTNSQNKVLITDNYTGNPATTQWTDITGTLEWAGSSGINWYSFNTYEREIPTRFLGESHVVVALYYSCTTSSTTWEVKNLQLTLNDQWQEDDDPVVIDPNNTNRNIVSATGNPEIWRLEFPKAKGDDMNLVITHATEEYGITYSLEWDCTKKSQRWTCYEFHNGIPDNNVGRSTNSWSDDPDIPTAYRTHDSDYKNTGFSRGHMCMSNDRQSSTEQNRQTFFISNTHPQYQKHNGGLWQVLENKVTNWGNDSDFRDTLYVVKAGTIDAEDQILTTTSTGLLVPKYFYMAVLCVKNNQYKALAFWTEHKNASVSNVNAATYAISIDELERRTGIDFFCNLPDDIEEEVEKAVTVKDWGM